MRSTPAFAGPTALARASEERFEVFGADAALLHSGAGVAGDEIHGHLLA
jgi:hypothetical protein